jgi:hypothetical protein
LPHVSSECIAYSTVTKVQQADVFVEGIDGTSARRTDVEKSRRPCQPNGSHLSASSTQWLSTEKSPHPHRHHHRPRPLRHHRCLTCNISWRRLDTHLDVGDAEHLSQLLLMSSQHPTASYPMPHPLPPFLQLEKCILGEKMLILTSPLPSNTFCLTGMLRLLERL